MIRAVVNSTPLIALSITGHFGVLKRLFDQAAYRAGFLSAKEAGGGQRTEGEWVYLYGIDVLLITFIKLSTPPSQKDTQEEVFTMESSTLLSPQTLTLDYHVFFVTY